MGGLGPCRATVPPHRVCRVTRGHCRCVVLCGVVRVIGTCVTCVTCAGRATMTWRGGGGGITKCAVARAATWVSSDTAALRTMHRGVFSPDNTSTVSWGSLENCAWRTLDTPVALVRVMQPGVAQLHSLTDPLLSLFDNNPNLQAMVLQLYDRHARAVAEHVKTSCGGPNRGMSLYLRDWEMPEGSPGIRVSGDVAARWRKWECKAH